MPFFIAPHRAWCAFHVVIALLFSSAVTRAVDLYVAPNGINDSAAGRGQSLGNPYKTIDYAADHATAGATVFIRAGTYRETVTPGVSGTVNSPITFKPYNNETVILTGLDLVVQNTNGAGAWTVDNGNIYRIQLTSSYGTSDQAGQQVFVNGQLMGEARWPNSTNPIDFNRANMAVATSGSRSAPDANGINNSTYVNAGLSAFSTDAWAGAVMVFNPGWGWVSDSTVPNSNPALDTEVTGNSGTTLSFRYKSGESGRNIPSNGDPFMLLGRRIALDAPGEFYFDEAGRDGSRYTLYLYQPGGGSPAASTVELRRRIVGIDLGNSSNLHFEGITVRAATVSSSSGSSGCVFDDVSIEYGAPNWVKYNIRTPLYLRGTDQQFINGRIVGSLEEAMRVDVTRAIIRNNVVSDCLRAGIYVTSLSSGAATGDAVDCLVEHNTVYNMGGTCIAGGGKGTQVFYNDACNGGLFDTDLSIIGVGGPYDGASPQRTAEWAYNWAHDMFAVSDSSKTWNGGSCLRLDTSLSNYLIHHNVAWNATSGTVMLWAVSASAANYRNANIRFYNNSVDKALNTIESTSEVVSVLGFDYRNNLCGDGLTLTNSVNRSEIILKNNIFPSSPSTAIPNRTTAPVQLNNRKVATGWVNSTAQPFGYQLASGSAAIDSGEVIPGITDGYLGAAPDIGALESGKRPFIPGATLRPRDLAGLVVTQQADATGNFAFAVTGLPVGRTLPEAALLKIGSAAASNNFSLNYDYTTTHIATAIFTAPAAVGNNQTVQFSLDGTSFTTLPATLSVSDPATAIVPAGVVRETFLSGAGSTAPQQFPGIAGAGWAGPWQSTTAISAVVSDTTPLLNGAGNALSVNRTSGTSAQEGVFRQWSATTRPYDHFTRLTFSHRINSATTVFSSASDNYTIALNNFASVSTGTGSTVYLRCFGATPAGTSLQPREWCVYNGPATYDVTKFRGTGIIAQPGVTCTFTLDLYAAAAAGTTSGKTNGTYDVTVTDGSTTKTVAGSVFRSAASADGGYLAFSTQQDNAADSLSFSIDSIELTTIPTATALATSANPADPGATVTLTATVSSTGGTGGTPTGTVTFFDGANSLGTGALDSSGVAKFVTTALSTGSHTITASYPASDDHAASTSIAVNQVIRTPYQAWTKANGLDALGQNGPLADPDNDGVPNLIEYALGRSPLTSEPLPPGLSPTGQPLSLTFTRIRSELVYTVQASADLSLWSDLAVNPGTLGQSVTITDTPPAGTTQRFLRLKITAP